VKKLSTLITKIDELKQLNKSLYEENTALKSDCASLKSLIDKLNILINTQKDTYDSAAASSQQNFKELLNKQSLESKQLIDSAVANTNTILENNNNTLILLTETIAKYDKLKTEYNQYLKSHP